MPWSESWYVFPTLLSPFGRRPNFLKKTWSRFELISWRVDAVFRSPIRKELSFIRKEPRLDSEEEPDPDTKSRSVVVEVWVDSGIVRPENFLVRSSANPVERVRLMWASRASMRRLWRLPSSFASQTHDPKMKVDPVRKIMSSKSIELLIVIAPKAHTWCASCRCLTTDSLPWGYPGQLFELRCMLELDGERRDSRFILVQALDRWSSNNPTSSQCLPLHWIDCVVSFIITGVPTTSLYIGREGYGAVTILVGSKEGVLN
jgi:hypothetical protein